MLEPFVCHKNTYCTWHACSKDANNAGTLKVQHCRHKRTKNLLLTSTWL